MQHPLDYTRDFKNRTNLNLHFSGIFKKKEESLDKKDIHLKHSNQNGYKTICVHVYILKEKIYVYIAYILYI